MDNATNAVTTAATLIENFAHARNAEQWSGTIDGFLLSRVRLGLASHRDGF